MAPYTLLLLATPVGALFPFSANVTSCPNTGARVFLSAHGTVTLNGLFTAATFKTAVKVQ
jgi:hypothetical protein